MKQQINLYLPEFRVEKDPITALLMAQVLGATFAVMVLVSAYEYFSRWQLNGELVGLQASLAEETKKTSELDGILARRVQSNELSVRLESAEALLDASQSIRDFLSQSKLGNMTGFSEFFKDLSRASLDGLSISEFTFTNGGESASLSGQVADSAMVPRYVSNIENGNSSLKEKHFSPSISKASADAQLFSFSLSTASE
jgi:hypothetical protein